MRKLSILSGIFAVVLAQAASAASVTFDLSATPADPVPSTQAEFDALPSSFDLNQDGLSVTVSAQSYSFISAAATPGGVEIFQAFFVEDEKIARNENGVGVLDSFGDDLNLESGVFTVFEFVQLTFSKPVSLVNLAFSAFSGGNDAYNIIEDRSGDNAFGAGDFISLDQAIGSSVAVNGFGTMTTFGILAPGPTASFQLQSVTVAPVPLPAGLPLLGAGLAGLYGLRRKAKKRA